MKSISYDNNYRLFADLSLQTHDISYDDIQYLLDYAEKEDIDLSERQKMVDDGRVNEIHDYILQDYLIGSVSGAVKQYPFKETFITFGDKENLFRGENSDFPCSLPSLRRKELNKTEIQAALFRIIANMRIWQFCKLVQKINIVWRWETAICNINYKALAQHYGFDTYLLDLTNDFRVALFFACCIFDPRSNCYRPLNESEIRGKHLHGIIYHSPRWRLDFANNVTLKRYSGYKNVKADIDSGEFDGTAFQIGYQPLMRCHQQSGYIYPLRYGKPLNEDRRFERMRFVQSVELSEKIFQLMEGSRKIFPNEGITELRDTLVEIQNSMRFSCDDLIHTYKSDIVDKTLFPSVRYMQGALERCGCSFTESEVEYAMDENILQAVNSKYERKSSLDLVGGSFNVKPQDKMYRDARCIEIYGKII